MAEEKRKRSVWRKWDLFAAISALFWLQFFGQYPHYSVIGLLSIPIILILLFNGNQYNTDIERSDTYKKNTRTFRIVMYSVLFVSVLLCFSARWDIKWYYPVQKKIYGTNRDIEDFLPDKLPDKTENYEAEFIRGAFPGSSRIEISFFTDKKTIDEYRAFASSRSMTEKNAPGAIYKERWRSELENLGIDFDRAEFYFSDHASDRYPKVYILDEKTGYVKIFY